MVTTGVGGGVGDGGIVTKGVGGCNKLAIAVFWSKLNADREPLDERAEPLPAEAAPGRAAAVGFVTGAGVVTAVPLVVLAVTATPDVGAARSV